MKPKLATELHMAPHIIQSIEVLTLPTLELQTFLQQQLEVNPVLESYELANSETQTEEKDGEEEEDPAIDEKELNNFANLEKEDWGKEYYGQDHIKKSTDSDVDKKQEALQNTPDKPISLQDALFQQFLLLELPEHDREIGEKIIYNIDADGYFRYPLEEVCHLFQPLASLEEVENVLFCIQQLEPPGVGARNIQECLILQLDEKDTEYDLKKELIEKYLPDIYHNKYPKIAKETGRNLEEIKRVVQAILKLNPKPGAMYVRDSSHSFIVPDVIVELRDDQYVTQLKEDYIPHLRIHRHYQQMLQKDQESYFNSKTREFIKKKIESANWIIDAIEQRRQTLTRVADKIVQYQQEFLQHGLTYLKPLKMQEIADELQIHVSTVSRAISDKYVQTPRGIFPLKFFFTGGIDKQDGNCESRVIVQDRILELIQQEDKKSPLSDEDIVAKLKGEGLEIARRTVTKYRKALHLPSSRRRRQY